MSQAGAAGPTQSVRLRSRSERALTRTQSQIWTAQRLHPDVPLANMGKRHRITGPLDPARLGQAFDLVVRASDVLRSVVVGDREPVAAVLAEPPAATEVVDLPLAELDRWCDERIALPIDARSCVYDSVLLRHGDDDWTWWLDLHHVATDAWASSVVFEASATAYRLLGAGTAPDEIDADALGLVAFGEHVDAVAERSTAEQRADRARRWAETFDGPSPPLTPYGPRGPRTTAVERRPVSFADHARNAVGHDLGDALRDAVAGPYRTLSGELSLLGLLVTATALALHRLDGRETVSVGVPIHHRSGPRAPRVIGPLMEIYPVRVTVEPDDTFLDLFGRVQQELIGVLRLARPGESPDHDVEVVVNVLTVRYGSFDDLPAVTEWMRSGHVEPSHVVRVQAYDYGDALRVELDLNTSLSDDGSHAAMSDHFANVLAAAVAAPDSPVTAVELVTPGERADLDRLNPPPPAAPLDEPVHVTIQRLLRADPTWVVAEHGDVELTAADLDRRADEVAAALIASGVGAGSRVGLRMRRGVDVLVAIQAVLRAGAAFVMLDPDDPPARHDTIVGDAGLAVVLDELPELVDAPVDLPPPDPDADAYVLYTSGSTGVPKGVPIPHRGLADYLGFALDAYIEAGHHVVMPFHSRLVFDLTITSLFLPLLAGGRIVVVDGDGLAALSQLADDRRLTVLKATPSQLDLLARLVDDPLPLHTVIVGGEAFRRPQAEAFAAVCEPGVRIFNEYGPTEAVVGCMIHEWDPGVDDGADVPIGHACPGAEVFVVDRHGRRSAPGAWGELCVRRPGMAAGYLNRPELTAERFTPIDGLGDEPLYRTGDRARVERPGVLVYGGRMDDQLKVGGIRLEPGEVEAALVAHRDVENAVVRLWRRTRRTVRRCERCGLGDDVPGVTVGADGVCSVCERFDVVSPQTVEWFKTPADLDADRDRARRRRRGDADCLHLLSGGKDSTYALYQLVERGWDVHALTLDTGYLSQGAIDNIRRTVADLGITHEFVTTDAMPDIFRDSLDRYANVCNGCYKTIYTLAIARAHELGIPVIVTGLSRGQFFETRLVPHQFEAGRFDPAAIDATVLEARRVYHHTADAVTELLPEQRVVERDDIFDEIEFVDFYRYVDVDLEDLYDFLDRRAPWVRPADTGRSTNCLINDAGIWVHRHERGYHNYAEPYSWDVRLGHKTRDEALAELDDDIDEAAVRRMLAEVGYEPKTDAILTAWYTSADGSGDIDPDELRRHLREVLPEHAVPSAFVRIDEVPLAASAKVDVAALPAPTRFHRAHDAIEPPANETEAHLCEMWAELLGLEHVGATDHFFDLGGASLDALEVVARIDDELGVDLPDAAVFQHPTVRELAVAIAERSALDGVDVETEIERLDASAPTPLSPGEEAMLFEYRVDPTDPRYNVNRLYTVRGALDQDRFERALATVVARHGPLHVAYDEARTELPVAAALSIAPWPAGDPEVLADELRGVPFDLDHGPLVRVHIGEHRPDEWKVLVALHHISIDAGTFDDLWREVGEVYAGREPQPLVRSYAEHGAWQRRRTDEHAEFWAERRRRRDGHPDVTLPEPAHPEPDGYLHRVATVSTADLVAAPGTTPFATALAAVSVVLAAHSRTRRVDIGVTASTKDHRLAAPLVGYFLNTLPLTIDVAATAGLDAVAATTSATVAEVIDHRTYPFAAMVHDARRAGEPVPDASCMLAYEQLAPAGVAGLDAEHRILASGVSVSDLTFFVQERGDLVQLGVEYRGTVIDAATARDLLDAFDVALDALCHRPELTADQVWREMAAAPDLAGPALPDHPPTVLAAIVEQAAAAPDAPAVVDAEGTTSYADLVESAAATAARIAAVAPGAVRVGIALPRRRDLVAAMLGAQLGGAAYVPLDPSVPAARLELVTDHADLDAVVVDRSTAALFPDTPHVHLDEPADVPTRPAAELAAAVGPDALAYVIFTSGTTGVPAGVAVTHANLAASTAARPGFYGDFSAPSPARFLLTPSIGFDSSMVGLFWPLTTGGTIVIAGDDDVHDVDALGRLVADHAVTHLLMVPSLYAALLRRQGAALAELEVAIVAGEACPAQLVADHHRRLPGTALVNEYGPTEATVWATAQRLVAGEQDAPIGRPVGGVTVQVAGDDGRPVAAGARGELWITGAGLTAGYVVGRAADAFVEQAGTRWYRTGDLVRLDGTGRLRFVGRVDDQLNVGGLRLEPAEVEALLSSRPGIAEAVVVPRSESGRDVLVAHVVAARSGPAASEGIDVAAIRRSLADRLPAAAVPRHVVVHDDLPRTVHGKLDRRSIATLPVASEPHPSAAGTAPDAHLDRVVTIFRQALGRPDLGPDDDFFEAGGDSLSAVEIVTALGDLAGRTVAISELLAGRTPVRMADAVEADVAGAAARVGAAVELVTLRPAAGDGPVVVMTAAWDDVFAYRALADAFPDEVRVVALVESGERDDTTLHRVGPLVDAFVTALDRSDQPIDWGRAVVLGWSVGGVVAHELGARLAADGRPPAAVALVDTYYPGEHRHLWSNRWWKYKSMLRPGRFSDAARELRVMAGRRVRAYADRLGRRLLAWAGSELPPVVERTSVAGIPAAALDHDPSPETVEMVLYAVATTNRERTEVPWRRLVPSLRVVPVEGRHRGLDSIMGAERVAQIVDDLVTNVFAEPTGGPRRYDAHPNGGAAST